MVTTPRRKLTEPLGSVTAIFGSLLLASVLVGAGAALSGRGSFEGLGHTSICVAQPDYGYGGGTGHLGVAARPGASISINGTLEACANHPGVNQRVLYTLTNLPSLLIWACVLFLLWRVIVAARRRGPFTVQVAAAMQRLGWLIIAGSVISAVVQRFALDQLLNTMLTTGDNFGGFGVITVALAGLLPVPALAGAALLTMARIIRLGADMDEEIKGTV
jgi:Protein of unknown function (DUF2975)